MLFWTAKGEPVQRTTAPSELGLTPAQWAGVASVLLAIAAFGLWIQLRIYPNHDVAWVLWGAREMMHGAKYGVDIIEPNPPLAWYLSMPTDAIAEWLNVPLDQPFRIAVALLGAIAAASLVWLRPPTMSVSGALIVAAVAEVGIVVVVGREFGQRDPLMMILVLPYLALAGRQLDGGPVPSAFARVAIGIVAGLGFALKPYFLAVPLLAELCLMTCGRRPRRLFRAENVSAAVVIAAYAAWILAFEQPYLRDVIPIVIPIYSAFHYPFLDVATPLALQILYVSAFVVLSFERKDGLGIILSASLCGFAISYLMQEGYDYHFMPVRTVALLLAARFMADVQCSRTVRWGALGIAAALMFFWWLPFRGWWSIARPDGALYKQIELFNDSIARHARGRSFLVVAVRTYPSFPAGIYAPARYISRTNGQWFLPAVAQARAEGHPSPSAERHAREFIMYDLRSKPALVLIDTDSRGHTRGPAHFDFLKFYEEDPKFRAVWRAYREVEPVASFRQFVRVKASPAGVSRHELGSK